MKLLRDFFVKVLLFCSAVSVSFGTVNAEEDQCPKIIEQLTRRNLDELSRYVRAAVYPEGSNEIIGIDGLSSIEAPVGLVRRNSNYSINITLQHELAPSSSKLFAAAIILMEEKLRLVTGLKGAITKESVLGPEIDIVFFDAKGEEYDFDKLASFVFDGMQHLGNNVRLYKTKEMLINYIESDSPTCLQINTVDSYRRIVDSRIIINSQLSDEGVIDCLMTGMFSSFGLYTSSVFPAEEFSDASTYEKYLDKKINTLFRMLNVHYSKAVNVGTSVADVEKGLVATVLRCK